MASRRFFGYDPYDYYYYTSPYDYAYPYYGRYPASAPAPARHAAGFFPAAAEEYPEPVVRADVRPRPRSRPVSVPVRFAGSESEPEEMEVHREARRGEMRAPSVRRMAEAVHRKRALMAEEAAVRLQAAARGFLARRMVREVRAVAAEAEEVARKVAADAEALRGDARGRIAVGEALMRLLLRLDAVHGAREFRRRVTKRVLALQDAVDALEPKTVPVEEAPEVADDAPPAVDMEEVHDAQNETAPIEEAPEVAGDAQPAVDMEAVHDAENETAPVEEAPEVADDAHAAVDIEEVHDAENEMAPESPDAGERGIEAETQPEVEVPPTGTTAEMEVDGGRATGGEAGPDKVAEQAVDGQNPEREEEAGSEWEMVTAESAAAMEAEEAKATEEKENEKQQVAADGLDARKVMEMVAALCERSAQQCAVIGALAERVDALERAVRRVEEADRRRRRNKKLKKEGKGSSRSIRSCYSD